MIEEGDKNAAYSSRAECNMQPFALREEGAIAMAPSALRFPVPFPKGLEVIAIGVGLSLLKDECHGGEGKEGETPCQSSDFICENGRASVLKNMAFGFCEEAGRRGRPLLFWRRLFPECCFRE